MPLKVACKADDASKHEYDINCLLFHQGKLYSAADDGKIKIWSPDLKLLGEIQAHPCSVFCICASNDTLYSCSNDGTVKSWNLAEPKSETIVLKDESKEFWRVRFSDGILFSGDDQGCVKVFKDGKFYGDVDVAVPVKDMLIHKNFLITSKDNDVVVSNLILNGPKPQYGVKSVLMGRGPLAMVDNNMIIVSRDGKGVIAYQILDDQQPVKQLAALDNAHEMIINGLTAANWDGSPAIFTGGWDKLLKKWKIDGNLKQEESCPVDVVITALTSGEKGQVFVGGADGHILRIDI